MRIVCFLETDSEIEISGNILTSEGKKFMLVPCLAEVEESDSGMESKILESSSLECRVGSLVLPEDWPAGISLDSALSVEISDPVEID